MAETAMDAFLLPRCSKRFPQEIGKGRPCLNAHIGKCMAVCSGKISCETYNQAVKNAVHLIRYGKKDILKTLNERMQEASDRLEFETAALLRDQINAITKLTAGQKVVVDPDVEMDVVALAGTCLLYTSTDSRAPGVNSNGKRSGNGVSAGFLWRGAYPVSYTHLYVYKRQSSSSSASSRTA